MRNLTGEYMKSTRLKLKRYAKAIGIYTAGRSENLPISSAYNERGV